MNFPAVIRGGTFETAVTNIISRAMFVGRRYQSSVQKVKFTSSACRGQLYLIYKR